MRIKRSASSASSLRQGHIDECIWGRLQEGSQGLKFDHSVKQHP